MIQTSAATAMNRYPQLFDIAARELENIPNPKILSFGCSTGDEVYSIKKYIPSAEIVGVDINQRSLAVAKKRDKASQHDFIHYHRIEWQKDNYYDCILALAVFQRTGHREEGRKQSLTSFQFQQFSDHISRLDKLLKKDGILVLDNADYSFLDLDLSNKYLVSEFDTPADKPRPIYSKENEKTSSTSRINRVFKKIKDQ